MSTNDNSTTSDRPLQISENSLLVKAQNAFSNILSGWKRKTDKEASSDSSRDGVQTKEHPPIEVPNMKVSDEEVANYIAQETGRDRVHAMFHYKAANGDVHPDIKTVIYTTYGASFLVLLIFSSAGARSAKLKFRSKNVQTKWETQFLAGRAHMDAMFIGSFKQGGTWGLKTAFLTGSFMVTAQSIATYRNKTSPYEFMAGGAVACSLFRFNLGLKGMLAGGLIGSVLGVLSGSIYTMACLLAGYTQADRHKDFVREQLVLQKELEYLKYYKPKTKEMSDTNELQDETELIMSDDDSQETTEQKTLLAS